MALVAALVVWFLAGALIYGVAVLAGARAHHPPAAISVLATVVQDAALVGSALFFAGMTARPRPAQFGLRGAPLGRSAGWVALAGVASFVFLAAWTSALHVTQRDDLPSQLGANDSTLALVAVTVLVTVIAPVAEEFFFRGFFFGALRGWAGPWAAAVLTGLTFGVIHGFSAPLPYLVPLAFFGFVLCLVRWRTGSLYPCMSLHALNNSLALGLFERWGWQIPVVMVAANLAIAALARPLAGRRPRTAGAA